MKFHKDLPEYIIGRFNTSKETISGSYFGQLYILASLYEIS